MSIRSFGKCWFQVHRDLQGHPERMGKMEPSERLAQMVRTGILAQLAVLVLKDKKVRLALLAKQELPAKLVKQAKLVLVEFKDELVLSVRLGSPAKL